MNERLKDPLKHFRRYEFNGIFLYLALNTGFFTAFYFCLVRPCVRALVRVCERSREHCFDVDILFISLKVLVPMENGQRSLC